MKTILLIYERGQTHPISKKEDQDYSTLNDVRPIVIKSHLTKICEKAILAKKRALIITPFQQVIINKLLSPIVAKR